MKAMNRLIALRKHWLTMNAVGDFSGSNIDTAASPFFLLQDGSNFDERFLRLSVWLGLLFVVVEGYLELKLNDARIDAFLAHKNRVGELRLFRNCIFHYQKDVQDPRLQKFLGREACMGWAHELSRAIGQLLERELQRYR
ncbi:MAG TPA: hypothetical protein VF254_07945 [Gammaproteobacteria bacterium]